MTSRLLQHCKFLRSNHKDCGLSYSVFLLSLSTYRATSAYLTSRLAGHLFCRSLQMNRAKPRTVTCIHEHVRISVQPAVKPSGTRIAAGGVRQRYNTAKRKRDKEQAELQDLLVDPQYDALFDGIGTLIYFQHYKGAGQISFAKSWCQPQCLGDW